MRKLPLKETLLVAGLLLLLLIGGWWRLPGGIEVIHPQLGHAVQSVYATGTVEPTVMMPIASRVGARLLTLNVDEGSDVKKDQVLAQLESSDLEQTLKDLQARAAFAQEDFDRKSQLAKQGYAAKATLDQARTTLDSAKAAARSLEAQISYTKLLAPADGRILRRDGEVGQMIPANQPVFWMSCCAPLRISAEVDEEDVNLVQPGQKVLIRADAFPGKIFHGEVQAITPKGDPVARSYRVRIVFTEDTPLLVGMTAETNIIAYEKDDALLVPSSAVTRDKVWVIRRGKLTQQAVSVGAKGPQQTEILSGVTADDFVVVSPERGLKEGSAPRIKLIGS